MLGYGVWGQHSRKRTKNLPAGDGGLKYKQKIPEKQRICSNWSSFFFRVGSQINGFIPYKSAKNIDLPVNLLYDYAIFLYLPESEGEKWI